MSPSETEKPAKGSNITYLPALPRRLIGPDGQSPTGRLPGEIKIGGPGDLTTILPGAVLGPIQTADNVGTATIIQRMLEGRMRGAPKIGLEVVDVRDVDLHTRAMTSPAAAGERFLGTGPFIWMADIARALKSGLGERAAKTSARELPNALVLREYLHAAADFDDSRFSVVGADLNGDTGWSDAVTGMDYVLHVASATLREADITEEQMIAAARDGVLRVLRASRDAGVKRVVLTSAYGAVGYGHKPQTAPFTEEDWTNIDANIAPYQRSPDLPETRSTGR